MEPLSLELWREGFIGPVFWQEIELKWFRSIDPSKYISPPPPPPPPTPTPIKKIEEA